ncbi:MAG: disulfide bond formation protein DsbA [Rhodospirillaceae bacterium]|nr:disulfide bond formation protein DsbA [Rhodospirillaceae bacterium]|tara:strand:- start:408 stop:1082 length:675 start_codon:yes stop_codon:yes gene_type:complete
MKRENTLHQVIATVLAISYLMIGQSVLAQSDTATNTNNFQLGTHYDRLTPTQPTSSSPDQIEVAEIFWYGCPHCYTFDPYLESWKSDLPANVNFVRIPAVWNPLIQLHARAYYAAEALGKAEEMHAPFFREIHINGNYLDTEGALQTFFSQFDVSPEDFANAFNSFAVHTKLQRADELSRRYRISAVPTVIVNGKYTANATSAGNYETLIEVIEELVASEAAND